MAFKIVISPLAHEDEYEAYKWYEDARPGLGEELLYELDIAYQKIAKLPQAFGYIDDKKDLRDYLIHRFPYLVVFRINADTIEIITVHHAKKHPDKKYGVPGT